MKSLVIVICSWIMAGTGVTGGTGTQVQVPDSVVSSLLNNMLRQERTVRDLSWELKATKTKLERSLNSTADLQSRFKFLEEKTADLQNTALILGQESWFALLVISNNEVLKFDDVTLNSGNAYSPKSGIFVTPVTGTYLFWANVLSTDKGAFAIILQKDGHELARGHTSYGVTNGVATIVYLTTLKKGDHVWFCNEERGGVKSKITGDNYSYYGGAFVSM